jgi:TldD protein
MVEMKRRDFLKAVAAGTAVAALPGIACAPAGSALRGGGGAASAGQDYFERFGVSDALLRRVLDRALGKGGDFAEVFLQHSVRHWVGLEDGEVNRAYTTVDLGAGIRVLKGDATGFAFCEDLGEPALLAAAETAASVADASPQAKARSFAVSRPPSRYALRLPWREVGIERKLPLVQELDRLVRARDSRIVKVSVSLHDEDATILVANSEGLRVQDAQPMLVVGASCVAEHQGKVETNNQSLAKRHELDFVTPERLAGLARRLVDRCVALFEAAPPPIGELPVVLAAGTSGILLHEAIGHGMEADFNRKGISIFADKIGKRIAPPGVTIVDDACPPHERGTLNVDDEGREGERTVLVEDGILRSYLHDRISARHYGLPGSTGSGRRQSFRFPPVPRMRVTYMENGPHKPDEVIASIKRGLYAEDFSNGQVAIGAGDFTFFLKYGRLIEDGKLTRVVKDANLIGSGPKVLEKVDMVADDLAIDEGGWTCGKDGQGVPVSLGLPTARASGGVSIGGRKA